MAALSCRYLTIDSGARLGLVSSLTMPPVKRRTVKRKVVKRKRRKPTVAARRPRTPAGIPVAAGPKYLVYEVRFLCPTTSTVELLYVGRSNRALATRKAEHLACVAKGSLTPFHRALRAAARDRDVKVRWSVVWQGYSHHESMLEEMARIAEVKARNGKCLLLNVTRGGYYDNEDSLKYRR
jgi:hypothetical protein